MAKNGNYKLTSPQKSIWNMEEFFRGTTINNICTPAIIYEVIEENLLKQAINNVVMKNDSFRIQINLEEGKPMQSITEFKPFDIEVLQLKDEGELKQIEQEEAGHKFDIINNPLYHFKLAIFKNGHGAIILTVNHIIADSWSLGLVIQNILKEYHALKNNEVLPETDTSYVQYIEAEQEYKQSKKYQADKEYWDKVYETIPEAAEIPSNNKNYKNISFNAKRKSFSINTETVKKIKDYCTANKISAFNFLMSIYSIYIGRVSNLDDFVIGTPILNRSNYKEKQTMGMFVNTAPVRINISEKEQFAEFSRKLGLNMISILKHQKYSYNQILEDIRSKNTGTPNLYNVMISYQITKAFNEEYGKYKTDWVFSNYSANDLGIHISDINDTGELLVSYDYLIDKYDEKDVQDIHARISYMINQVLMDEDISTADIEIVTEEERNRILYEFNDTAVDYPKDKTITQLFEEQVEKTPDNIAVVFEEQELTYRELNEKANSLARYLREKGVEEKDNVCILLNRSIELIITIYGVIKSGASYVLLDTEFPEERISYIISDTEAKWCIINNLTANLISSDKVINISEFDYLNYDIENLNISHKNAHLCTIYTSGSTGVPKGVLLHNQGFVNLIYAFDREMKISRYRNILGIATVSFDMFAVELYSSTLLGNTLILANEEEQKNPIAMSKLIKKNNVEFLITTPTRIELLLIDECGNPLKNVKAFQLGGEKLTDNLYNKLKSVTNAKIYNGYGPTEITACCTNKLVSSNDITIGKPISNVQVYICGINMRLLPIGTIGNIYVAGVGVSNGYLKNEEATSKNYAINPFGQGVIYNTGDLGRYKDNGEIEYIGRSDFQVKIRGLRIELGEIENRILELSEIDSCVVVKKSNNTAHEYLCAYYTSKKVINSEIIRKYLEKILPKYMIPIGFVQLEVLPVNINGKIDTKKLPEPQVTNARAEIIPPRNEIDTKLIRILKELLNVDFISIDNSFVELGGDSLSAINLCVKVQNEFNVQLFVKDVLEHQTIQELSDIISRNINTAKEQIVTRIPEAEYYQVSSAQKRMYYTSKVAGDSSVLYNVPGGVIFDGSINTERLESCFKTLIERHESLRTYLEVNNEEVVQKILDKIDFKLDILKGAKFENIDNIFKDFVKPFDLSKAPLFRAKFIEFTNEKSALFLDMHHIISDGTSLAILVDEICKLYNGDNLKELNITYKDYAVYENERLKNGELKEAEEYWVNRFKGEIPVLDMPTNYPRPEVQVFEGKKIYSKVDVNTKKKIEDISKELGVTPYMLLISAYYVLLSKYTSQENIVVGSPVVGRDISDTYDIIGMFVNTLALRQEIDSTLSFKEFLLKVKENTLNAYKYQTYPFDELVNKLNIKRDTSRNPLFDVMFIYQNNGFKKLEFKDVKSEYYIPDTNISKFDLSLEAVPNKEGIELSFEYAIKLFKEEFIQNLSNHYLNILNIILENIDTKIEDISMLSREEENKILYKLNDTAVDYPKDKTITEIFEEQVKNTPDNVAVVFEDQELTYRELNDKANSLARYLIKYGVKKQDIIALRIDKSLEMIIGILAIIKAGCCYLPINMQFPQERTKFMIEDSNAKLLLGSKTSINDFELNIEKIDISLSNKEIYAGNTENLGLKISPEDLIYIIYTSGSTGTPKGAMLCHRNVVRLMKNDKFLFDFSDKDVWTMFHSVAFDFSVWEMYGALLYGGKLVIVPTKVSNNPKLFLELMEKEQVTVLNQTPTYFYNLLNIELNNPHKNLKIRYIIFGGEALKPNLIMPWHKIHTNTKLINMYGITETTVHVTFKELSEEDLNNGKSNIGVPIPTLKILLLDKNLKLVPYGVPGEICVCGDGVFKGYLNRPELNETKLIPNPYNKREMIYRSADSGILNFDNTLEYLGRIDTQIKIRGLRVELGEIENLIIKYPNINNVTVIKQIINDREFITAYYIANKKIVINELRKYLSKSLPKYMIPSYFVALDSFPYTPNGKIDKKALPLPTEVLNISKEEYIEPRTKMQKQLVNIWERLLNTRPIGINDNFFELGGDSILAMNLNIELLKISNKINYSDIFRFPTIVELEEKINSDDDKPMFSKIENLSDNYVDILKNCTKKEKIKTWHPRNILLTGSTGFLGIHILEEFIKNETGNVYCIVREEPGLTAEAKIHQKLNYYFGSKYDDLIGNRIFAVIGSISEPGFGLNQEELLNLANSVDVVINSAARVAHFGNYNDFYNSNVKSVRYIIDFCKSFNKKLFHISTVSVAGGKLDSSYLIDNNKRRKKEKKLIFNESSLYVSQILDNVYTRSKFEAESYVLDAISKGLDGYILRMGNLMPRYCDGVFQENILDNAFINKIISFIKIGIIPSNMLKVPLEFTPVDFAASAVYRLVTHPSNKNRVFHLYNYKDAYVVQYLKVLKRLNYNMEVVSQEEFKDKINSILQNENNKNLLNNLINDLDKDLNLDYKTDIIVKSGFTNKYLRKIHFRWKRISNKYLIEFTNLIKRVM